MSGHISHDYIVVGAGSAGCVLAGRLSENGRHNVLLLEAGGTDRRFWINIPIGYGKTYYQKAVNWMYTSEPIAGLNNKTSYWPRGKVLGGSSSINAMVYIRGNPLDFDDWAKRGNPGWSYRDVLPYFMKAETYSAGPDTYRGGSGPLYVSDVSEQLHPLCQDFIQAGEQAGLSYIRDFNGAQQEGVGVYQITAKDGRRMSTARAYLRPAMKRPNLRVITRAHATRILFDKTRAIGVEYKRNGKIYTVFAKKEVIVCAGAINSPQLLQLSGIGPGPLLHRLGIPVVHALPAVGQHLQDHLGVDYMFRSRRPTLNNELGTWYRNLQAGMRYVLTRRGPLGLSINQGGGFFKTSPALDRPNMQLYFSPISYTRAPSNTRPLMRPDPFPAFLLGVSNCRPKSEGYIHIQSSDPYQAPEIQPNYLTDDHDIRELLDGVRFIRKLAATPALKSVIIDELRPGPSCVTEEQLIEDIRDSAWTVFHASSTCRMGPDPSQDVVDHRLRVHGVQNLRIADTSICPTLVSGNTNAAAIMIGEKAADLILSDQAL